MTLPRTAVLALLAACTPAPRPEPLHNVAAGSARKVPPACPQAEPALVKLAGPAVGGIAGIVVDDGCELVAGATLVVLRGASATGTVDITDERGRFQLVDLAPDRYVISVYYLDTTLEHSLRVRAGAVEHVQLAMPPPVQAEPRITRDLLNP